MLSAQCRFPLCQLTINYLFQTDQAARKWNDGWRDAHKLGGHLATGLITLATGGMAGGWAAAATAFVLGVSKDEIQSRIPFPRVSKGWKYTVTMKHTYSQRTMHLSSNEFVVEHRGVVFDAQGVRQPRTFGSERRYPIAMDASQPNAIPDSIARSIVSVPSATKTVNLQ